MNIFKQIKRILITAIVPVILELPFKPKKEFKEDDIDLFPVYKSKNTGEIYYVDFRSEPKIYYKLNYDTYILEKKYTRGIK